MSFARPEWLWALLALPLLVAVARVWSRSRARAAEAFAGTRARRFASLHDDSTRILLAFVLILLAVAGPQIGVAPRSAHTAGVDLVVALDVSRSMWVEDIGESRLERARREIRAFVRDLSTGRVALVAFSGAAETLCPRTSDRFGFESRLDDAIPDARPGSGSSLVAALDASLEILADGEDRDRVVLIASDGESRDENHEWTDAIARARRQGVIVHALVVGTEAGGPVPAGGKEQDRFVETAEGPVISRADASRLSEATRATGGTLLRDGDDPGEWTSLARSLALDAGVAGERRILAPVDRYRWPLLLALILVWPRRAEQRTVATKRAPARAAAWFPIVLAFSGARELWNDALSAHDRGDLESAIAGYRQALLESGSGTTESAAIGYDLAIALLHRGELELAEAEFDRLALLSTFLARARHGSGLAAATSADRVRGTTQEVVHLRRARTAFLEALRAGAGDASASNLEYVTRRLIELERGGDGTRPRDPSDPETGGERDPNRPRDDSRSGDSRESGSETGAVDGTPPREGATEGPVAGDPENEAREPEPPGTATRRLRHDEIEAIVAEFERRRVEHDRSRAGRARALEPFDW